MMVGCFLLLRFHLLKVTFTEFAEYTSAQERIALGKKSRKLEASRRRDTMKELIADAWVVKIFLIYIYILTLLHSEEEDEETIEWEQEQLRRGGHKTPEPSAEVKQVYKPAPSNVSFLFVLMHQIDLDNFACSSTCYSRS
jgi:hypothetical protein